MRNAPQRVHDSVYHAHIMGWLQSLEFHSGTGKTACIFKDSNGKFYRVQVEEMEHLNEQSNQTKRKELFT